MKIETAKVSFKAKLIIKKMRNESFKHKENQVIKQLLNYKYVPFDINGVKIDSEFDLEIIELKKAKGYLLKPKAGLHEKVIYQIHGGAYVIPLNESNFKGAYLYSKYTNNSDVFLIDYTVAEKFPRAIEDVCDGYDYLLTKYKNDNISVAGHSAGGGLALGLAFHIREKEIAKPKCLLLASPWLDLTCSGKSYMENRIVDTMFGSLYTQKEINLPNLYADKEYEKNEYASPIFGKFNDLPPILVNTGSDEMVLSDSLSLEEKANAEGSFVKLYVHKGMWHDFYTKTDAFKEAKEVWKNIGLFIENPS
jgi:acetyl esterase/lipase